MDEKKFDLKAHHSKQGIYKGIILAVVVAIVLILNMFLGQLPTNLTEYDMSESRIYTVTDQSVKILDALDTPVKILVVAEDGTVDERIEKFLTRYAALSDYLTLEHVDPVKYPSVLDTYKTEENTVVVSCEKTENQQIINIADIITYNDLLYKATGVKTELGFDCEGLVTSAVDFVVSSSMRHCYQMTGHGETELSNTIEAALKKTHFNVGTVNVLSENSIPYDCELLVCNAPTGDLAADETGIIEKYIADGGQVILLFAQEDSKLPNWNSVLGDYGLVLGDGYIADMSNYYGASYYRIFPEISSASALTKGFESNSLLMENVRVLELTEEAPEGYSTDTFLTTSGYGYAVTEENQEQGIYVLGSRVSNDKSGGSLTVYASSSLISESITSSFTSLSNVDMFVRTAKAGFKDTANSSIPAKNLAVSYNSVKNPMIWNVIFIFVLPAIVLISGFVTWLRRRNL